LNRVQTTKLLMCAAVAAAVLATTAPAALAQGGSAKIIGVVLQVEHRVGPNGAFVNSKPGVSLPAGSRVRTGARSKAALKFPDGAVIKMGERADLVIQSATDKSVSLNSGKLWAKVIAGTTARVQGSSGVAVVKGTEWTYDGKTVTVYDGTVSYETAAAEIDVTPGVAATAQPDGSVRLSPAPGREYPGGDLIQWFGGIRAGGFSVTPGGDSGRDRKGRNIAIDQSVNASVTPRSGPGSLSVVIEGWGDGAADQSRRRYLGRGSGVTGAVGPKTQRARGRL